VTVGLSLLAAQLVVRVLPTAKRVAPALPEAVPVGAVAP
jgi:hypothetical protein